MKDFIATFCCRLDLDEVFPRCHGGPHEQAFNTGEFLLEQPVQQLSLGVNIDDISLLGPSSAFDVRIAWVDIY